MRKLLMASTAVFGVSLGVANAAVVSSGPAPIVPSGGYAGLPVVGYGTPSPAAPTPGTIVVHIDLRQVVFIGGGWYSGNSSFGNKQQPVAIGGYARLYFGFDGLATNGLQYGMFHEIRTNQTNVSGGSDQGGTNTGITSGTLFFRRDYAYVGTATLGRLKIGSTDGPLSLLTLGGFDNVGEGLWNGDVPGLIAGVDQVQWPFGDQSVEYATAKAVYVSPTFAGLSFLASYEPNSNVTQDNICGGGFGATGFTGCTTQATSNLGTDLSRRRNTVEVGVHYVGGFAGVGVEAAVDGLFGGRVRAGPFNEGLTNGGLGHADTPKAPTNFDNIALGHGGLVVSFAGFQVGGELIGGDYNGLYNPKPAGAASAFAYAVGAAYNIGPLYVGGQFFQFWDQGQPGLQTQQLQTGLGAGFNYNIAAGIEGFGEYVYGTRRQNGFNYLAGEVNAPSTTGTTFANLNSKVQSQAALLGFILRW